MITTLGTKEFILNNSRKELLAFYDSAGATTTTASDVTHFAFPGLGNVQLTDISKFTLLRPNPKVESTFAMDLGTIGFTAVASTSTVTNMAIKVKMRSDVISSEVANSQRFMGDVNAFSMDVTGITTADAIAAKIASTFTAVGRLTPNHAPQLTIVATGDTIMFTSVDPELHVTSVDIEVSTSGNTAFRMFPKTIFKASDTGVTSIYGTAPKYTGSYLAQNIKLQSWYNLNPEGQSVDESPITSGAYTSVSFMVAHDVASGVFGLGGVPGAAYTQADRVRLWIEEKVGTAKTPAAIAAATDPKLHLLLEVLTTAQAKLKIVTKRDGSAGRTSTSAFALADVIG